MNNFKHLAFSQIFFRGFSGLSDLQKRPQADPLSAFSQSSLYALDAENLALDQLAGAPIHDNAAEQTENRTL
ncbi:hypothetical protein [Aestuariivirga sp.]|uniref:hypothetical protein n=1 Tax=Aestuariivirga sp. TaxID=2650926 RepID=UPI0037834900